MRARTHMLVNLLLFFIEFVTELLRVAMRRNVTLACVEKCFCNIISANKKLGKNVYKECPLSSLNLIYGKGNNIAFLHIQN